MTYIFAILFFLPLLLFRIFAMFFCFIIDGYEMADYWIVKLTYKPMNLKKAFYVVIKNLQKEIKK